ncbi:MAG: DUF5979 domain-containing protein [Acidimicrobiia bacterium]
MAGRFLRRVAPAIALVLIGSVLAGFPSAGATDPDPPTNPVLEASCGLDFVLVLDESNSIEEADEVIVEQAATAFLTALKDTGSTVSVVQFATTATPVLAPTALTTANMGLFTAAVNINQSGGTNWEDGLAKARSQFGDFPDDKPQLVVIITDGTPTYRMEGGDEYLVGGTVAGPGSSFDPDSRDEAVIQAQKMWAAGVHTFAVGVDMDGANAEPSLQAITGTDPWVDSTSDILGADYTKVGSFGGLTAALEDVATELCGGTVTIEKRLDGTLADGWTFSATNGASPASDTTGVGGTVQFDWSSVLPVQTTIAETPKTGIVLKNVICNGAEVPSNPLSGTVNLTVGPEDVIHCVFHNTRQKGTLTINKSVVGNPGTSAWSFSANCGGVVFPATIPAAGGSASIPDIDAGTSCTVTEAPNPNFSTTSNPSPATVVMDANGEAVSFTNTRLKGTLTINKIVVGNAGTSAWSFSANCGGVVFPASIPAAGGSASIPNIDAGTSCTVTEAANPNFSTTSNPSPATVVMDANGETVSFTNTRKNGNLTVTKVVQGGTGTFVFDVDCNDGVDRDPVSIVGSDSAVVSGIPTETTCVVTEQDHDLFTSVDSEQSAVIDLDGETLTFTNIARSNGITVDKKVNGGDHATSGDALQVHAGDTLTYTVVITNNGEVPITLSSLADSLAPGFAAGCPQGVGSVLAPEASITCTYEMAATVDAKNVASVTGVDGLERDVSGSDETYVDVLNPAITIVKTADLVSVGDGGTVTFTYVVTNTGDTPLTNVKVADDVLGDIGTIPSLARTHRGP